MGKSIKSSMPYLLLVLSVMVSGCSAEEAGTNPEPLPQEESFMLQAVIGQTKTVFTPPFKVEWAGDDALSALVRNSEGYKSYKFTKTAGQENTFQCMGFNPEGITEYNLIYPYTEGLAQVAEDGFSTGAVKVGAEVSDAPLCGHSEVVGGAPVISMRHCTTLFEVKVQNTSSSEINISSVKLSNNVSAPMSGTFLINTQSGELRPADVLGETVLNVTEGRIQGGETKSFYIVSAPFSLGKDGILTVSLMVDGKEKAYPKPMNAEVAFLSGKVNHTMVSYPVPEGAVTGISLDKKAYSCDFALNPEASPVALSATVYPENAIDKTLTWTTSDPYVARVSEEGVVTPVGHGKAVITATANDGHGAEAKCIVTVKGVRDLNYGKGDIYYDKIYYPVNIEVTSGDGTRFVQTWLDRNLGASEVASSSNKPQGYGSLFQWSRKSDGHEQVKWTSATKGAFANKEDAADKRVLDRKNPGTNKFIWVSKGTHYDWAEDPATDKIGLWGGGYKWGGVDQTHVSPLDDESQANNPCPEGYRLPSAQELYQMIEAMAGVEVADDMTYQVDGIASKLLDSAMHIPTPGYGNEETGNISYGDNYCVLWCNAPGAVNAGKYETARRVFFSAKMTSNNFQTGTYRRARGGSVRCIRHKALDSTEF